MFELGKLHKHSFQSDNDDRGQNTLKRNVTFNILRILLYQLTLGKGSNKGPTNSSTTNRIAHDTRLDSWNVSFSWRCINSGQTQHATWSMVTLQTSAIELKLNYTIIYWQTSMQYRINTVLSKKNDEKFKVLPIIDTKEGNNNVIWHNYWTNLKANNNMIIILMTGCIQKGIFRI